MKFKVMKGFVFKDLYEYKNNYAKTIWTLGISIFATVIAFNFMSNSSPILSNHQIFTEVISLTLISLIYVETTLFQVYRDKCAGIYEKYFINDRIKKYEIILYKCFTNLIISFVCLFLVLLINNLLSSFVENRFTLYFNISFLIKFVLACIISTCLAFINSLIVTGEKNATSYGASLLIVYFGFYKSLEIFHISNMYVEYLGLIIIAIILLVIVTHFLNMNKFIKK